MTRSPSDKTIPRSRDSEGKRASKRNRAPAVAERGLVELPTTPEQDSQTRRVQRKRTMARKRS